jgi:hypothetical protein
MSVTISIHNNILYCRAQGYVKVVHDPCQCVVYNDDAKALAHCSICHGTGVVEREEYPYDLNLSNHNFTTLWSAMGLTPGEYLAGDIDSRHVLAAVRRFSPERAIRKGGEHITICGLTGIDCGLTQEQIEIRIMRIHAIAMEAARREEYIVWS